MTLQGEDGCGDGGHAVEAAAGLAEDAPGLQPCDASFDRCSRRRQGPVDGSLGRGEVPAGEPSDRCGHPWAGADVGAVGEDGDALAFADPDDAVGAGRGQVVGAAGQRGRDPQQVACGIGDDLHVHAVTAVLLGEVRPAVADPVALGERPVEQDVARVPLVQDPQQARRLPEQMLDDGRDVGVGGADGYAEAGGDLRERVVPAKVDQAHEGPLVGRELATAVTLAGDDEHGYPLDQGVRQVECDRIGNQRGSCAHELRRRTPLSSAPEPGALRSASPSPGQRSLSVFSVDAPG